MSCLGECRELGPPPDTILFLPPPPPPAFLQNRLLQDNVSASPCAAQLCGEWGPPGGVPGGASTGDYVELPHQDVEATWPGGTSLDDTWLLVLVASSIGVLLLGALLALFLLKCREEHRQQTKHVERQVPATGGAASKVTQHPTDIVAPTPPSAPDNRLVWAALTPRGTTRHYVSENYPRDMTEHHYETIDGLSAGFPAHNQQQHFMGTLKSSFDNSGFMDYDYEEPTPLMQLGDPGMFTQDMRCISTLRRMPQVPRPRVSSPTRIEHPNLPPLNLHPHHVRRTTPGNTLTRRPSETGTILKYNIN